MEINEIYTQSHIKPYEKDKCYFDSYDPAELEQLIKNNKIIHQIYQKHKNLYQMLVVIGDFADGMHFARTSQLLHQLYIRGGHNMIHTFTSTQELKQISPIAAYCQT